MFIIVLISHFLHFHFSFSFFIFHLFDIVWQILHRRSTPYVIYYKLQRAVRRADGLYDEHAGLYKGLYDELYDGPCEARNARIVAIRKTRRKARRKVRRKIRR